MRLFETGRARTISPDLPRELATEIDEPLGCQRRMSEFDAWCDRAEKIRSMRHKRIPEGLDQALSMCDGCPVARGCRMAAEQGGSFSGIAGRDLFIAGRPVSELATAG